MANCSRSVVPTTSPKTVSKSARLYACVDSLPIQPKTPRHGIPLGLSSTANKSEYRSRLLNFSGALGTARGSSDMRAEKREKNAMRWIGRVLSCVLVISAWSCADLWAQATAQISGTVQDQSAAVMPGVEVGVRQTEAGIQR